MGRSKHEKWKLPNNSVIMLPNDIRSVKVMKKIIEKEIKEKLEGIRR